MSEELEFICIGRALSTGGKVGSKWALLSSFEGGSPAYSFFQSAKALIGGIYRGAANLTEEGKLETIPKSPTFVRMADGDWGPARLEAEAIAGASRAEALERKVKASKGAIAEVNELARILKAVPYHHRAAALHAINGLISDAARKIR